MRQGRGAAAAAAAVVGAVTGLVTVLVGWAATGRPAHELLTGPAALERTFTPPTHLRPAAHADADGTVDEPDNPDSLPYWDAPAATDSVTWSPCPGAAVAAGSRSWYWLVLAAASLFLLVSCLRVTCAARPPALRTRHRTSTSVVFDALGRAGPAGAEAIVARRAPSQDAAAA